MRRTNGLVSPAQMDTTDYPPEGQNVECDHQWVHKAGAGYRATPVAICVKCHAEKRYCAKCGEKL